MMTYRNIGLLSLGFATAAALTVYATTKTNAQPPLGSANRNAQAHDHTHDHQHDGHDHSHDQPADAQPSDATVVPAPSGGPPPLPSQPPGPSTRQDAPAQREPASDNQADSPPTLLPPRPDSDYGCRQGSYACPNAERYRGNTPHSGWPLDVDRRDCPFDFSPPPSDGPYSHVPSHRPFDVNSSCEYDSYGSSLYFRDDERCYYGRELHGHGLNYYGH